MNKEYGRILKELRISRGLTLQQIQKQYGHNISWISQLENGKVTPRPKTIKVLAQIYEVDYVELYNKLTKGE